MAVDYEPDDRELEDRLAEELETDLGSLKKLLPYPSLWQTEKGEGTTKGKTVEDKLKVWDPLVYAPLKHCTEDLVRRHIRYLDTDLLDLWNYAIDRAMPRRLVSRFLLNMPAGARSAIDVEEYAAEAVLLIRERLIGFRPAKGSLFAYLQRPVQRELYRKWLLERSPVYLPQQVQDLVFNFRVEDVDELADGLAAFESQDEEDTTS